MFIVYRLLVFKILMENIVIHKLYTILIILIIILALGTRQYKSMNER